MASRFARFAVTALSLALAPSITNCQKEQANEESSKCERSEAIKCVGADGCRGYRPCREDGSGFGECDCGAVTASSSGSGGGGSTVGGGGGMASSEGGVSSASRNASEGQGGSHLNEVASITAVGGTSGELGTAGVILVGTDITPSIFPYSRSRLPICDAWGGNCKCLTLASFGASASKSYGSANSATTAFESWLVESSNAIVTFVPNKPAITPEYLAGFDVIILQDLRTWQLSSDEVTAFQNWVKEGGGVIALSGYFPDGDTEVAATNRLLADTGMHLLADEGVGEECPSSSKVLCSNSGSQEPASPCCYCWGNVVPITDLVADSPFNKNIKAIGAYRGRAIDAGAGSVVARFEGQVVAAYKPFGLGKVFIFGDEWVTYTSQWGDGSQHVTPDPYNPCWDVAAQKPRYAGHVFQTLQFWYNAITNVAPPLSCPYMVMEPAVIPQWD